MGRFSIKSLAKTLLPGYQTLHLEYPVDLQPRYGHGRPAHAGLEAIVEVHRHQYAHLLRQALALQEDLVKIRPLAAEKDPMRPGWNNGFLPGLDIVMLYTILARGDARQYVEIGSGNSTKVAHLARTDHAKSFRITSIDPAPRAEIDRLADRILRLPFEQAGTDWMDGLLPGDVVFVDNSHRVLPNSDATAFFLDALPVLPPGVIVHIHDVYLPYDYPQEMCDRAYSEQYMLAALLLANPARYRTIMPCYFVSEDEALSRILEPVWTDPRMPAVERHGGSFWFEVTA